MKCPFCSERMVEIESGGVHVDRCGRCHGLFFEAGELTTYTGNPGLEYQTRDLARTMPDDERCRRCPACAGTMKQLPRTAGHFDVCPDCGGFALDAVAVAALAAMTVAAVEAGKPLWERFAQSLDSGAEEVIGTAIDVGAEVVSAVGRAPSVPPVSSAPEAAPDVELPDVDLSGAGELAEGALDVAGGALELLGGLLGAMGELLGGL